MLVAVFACRVVAGHDRGQPQGLVDDSTQVAQFSDVVEFDVGVGAVGPLLIDFGAGTLGGFGVGRQVVQRECDCVGGGFAAGDQKRQDLVDDVVVVESLAGVGVGGLQHSVEDAGVTRTGIVPAGVDDAGHPLPDVGLVGIVLAFACAPK